MTTTKTADVEGTLQQIYALAAAGCDIVRCTCNEAEAAEGLAQIVPRSPVPIVAEPVPRRAVLGSREFAIPDRTGADVCSCPSRMRRTRKANRW